MDLGITVLVELSKGRHRPPSSNIIFCAESNLAIKSEMLVLSNGLVSMTVVSELDKSD